MSKNIDPDKSLIFDADVIFHYRTGDRLLDLFKTFTNKSLILDQVYKEVTYYKDCKTTIDNLIATGFLFKVDFPTNPIIIKEYSWLSGAIMNRGKGESACMAYCKHTKDVIASSNLKDIKEYCKLHEIDYLTTVDFIEKAYSEQIWGAVECDEFIKKVNEKHKIPYSSFDHLRKARNLKTAS